MFRRQFLSQARTTRRTVLFAYLLVVVATLIVPWLQPTSMGSVCSTAASALVSGTDADGTGPAIGCALCLPQAGPAGTVAATPCDAVRPEAWQRLPLSIPSDPSRTALPPARGPPAV